MHSVMYDPLIGVEWLDGREGMCGIREIFARAHKIRDLKAYSDMSRLAMIRLLLAFLMDFAGLVSQDDRADLLDAGHFDVEILDRYLAECEQDGPRFELFDEKHPFMQCAYDESLDAKADKPVSVLIPELPSGNNHIVFFHAGEDEHALEPSEAFQGMLVTYLFCTAGAQGFPSGVNNTPPVYALIEGGNLMETLVLNSLSKRECERHNISYGLGDVPWRSGETVEPKKLYQNVSLLQAFTWRPRRIKLRQNQETGMVDRVFFQQGHNFLGNELWRDPLVPRVKKKDGSYANLKPELGRALWRDSGTLVLRGSEAQPLTITAMEQISDSHRRETLDLSLTGMITSNAAILGATHERLAVPLRMVEDVRYANRFFLDLAFCEDAQRVLHRSTADGLGSDIARVAQEIFLLRMHDYLFGRYLAEMFAGSSDGSVEVLLFGLLMRFDDEVLASFWAAFDQSVYLSGTDARSLQKQVQVERTVIGWYYNRKKEREAE